MATATARGNRRSRYLRLASVAAAGLLAVVALAPASAARTHYRAPAASDDWPTFGHDAAHSGVSPDTTIGVSSASGLAKRWSVSVTSVDDEPSPSVAYNASRKQTLVYDVTLPGVASAFNASTGALVWRHSVGAEVFSSPAVSGNTVYFGTNSGTLEALNAATGAVQCVFTVPTAQPAGTAAHIFSSPVVGDVDGTGPIVFFGDPGVSSASQSYIAGHFWAVTGVGNTGGNCQEKWAYDNWVNKGKSTAETGVWGEPALVKQGNGTWAVVFGTSNPDNSVYALNAVTGARIWHFRTLTRGPDEDVGAGPTISPPGDNGFADGVVYVDGKDGIEYALNLLTGEQIWSFTLGPGSQHSYGVAEAALTGITLITCYAGSVFALNAITGAELWEVTLGGTIEASPAVAGGTGNQVLFIGDLNKDEYGLSLQDGSQVFSASVTGNLEASAAVANGMLYFTSGSTLYAYAPPSARRDALRG